MASVLTSLVFGIAFIVWYSPIQIHTMTVPTTRIPWNINDTTNQCKDQKVILELCQRCAVKTKSSIVYPMCCKDMEAAQDWCRAYLSYGRRQEIPHYTKKT